MISRIHTKIIHLLQRNRHDSNLKAHIREFFAFGYKEAISCLFPAFIFLILGLSKLISVPGIARYDLLLLLCLGMQYLMYRTGLETKHELYVICFFHFIGVSMEVFKVSHGAWQYPEPAMSKVFGVPLFSGFMYASVASYICQAWRHCDLRMENWPKLRESICLAILIYGNFFTNLYIPDLRLFIIPLLMVAFRKTWVSFDSNGNRRRMPMLLSFFLIAFFVWIAENIGTFLGAWVYPHQAENWSMVRMQLMSSWFLLVIVSVIIVAALKMVKEDKYSSSCVDEVSTA